MRVVGILLVSLLLSIPGMGQKKKDAAKEFEGTIKYSISAEGIEGLEDALAMMPANMREVYIKSRDGKSIFSVMGTSKMYYDKNNKGEMLVEIDLSMLGMGSFCIPTPIADTLTNTMEFSKDTKKILGLKASRVIVTDSIEFWVSKDYYLNFPVQSVMYYLPLEFDIDASGINVHLVAKEISFDKPAKEEVEVSADCQRVSMEELQEIMEEMQEGFMPEEDLDLEEDE
ncbi:MAG: hypothetical protein IKT84_01655 [Bacteroidales bacterium]|nr:hypothetical protein [Bacteroidales bacterium]